MDKYMTKQTIEYSDGTETVLTYTKNPEGELIEATVAEATAVTSPETIEEVAETSEVESSEGAE